jgi:hypothetical protein
MAKHEKRPSLASMIFSYGSRGVSLAWLNRLIVGSTVVDGGWRIARSAHVPEDGWKTVPGDLHGTKLPLPAFYKMATVLSAPDASLEALRSTEAVRTSLLAPREAVALDVGGTAVVGVIGLGEMFGSMVDENGAGVRREIALRIGHEGILAAMGLWLPEQRAFHGIGDTSTSRLIALTDLPESTPVA